MVQDWSKLLQDFNSWGGILFSFCLSYGVLAADKSLDAARDADESRTVLRRVQIRFGRIDLQWDLAETVKSGD